MKKVLLTLILVAIISNINSQNSIKVATWNLEHLGGLGGQYDSRGGTYGCGKSKILPRTDEQLENIAKKINDLNLDIIAIQEVHTVNNDCKKLASITKSLGASWKYVISEHKTKVNGFKTGMSLLQTAFVFDTSRVMLDTSFTVYYPRIVVQNSDLHDRPPFVAKFTCLQNGEQMNDFVLINLHLASGQPKTINKAIAMSNIVKDVEMIIYSSPYWLENAEVNGKMEDDIVFLGDFNHDPWDKKEDRLDYFMTNKFTLNSYRNLLNPAETCTRMNTHFSSRIDHAYVSEGMEKYLKYDYARLWKPSETDNCDVYGKWRETYSDHFPLFFTVLIDKDE
jgi:endonuclease/exonuclease/phosphatase family metal-dependent hydrolase